MDSRQSNNALNQLDKPANSQVKSAASPLSKTVDSTQRTPISNESKPDQSLNARMFRIMALAAGLAVLASLLVAPWRVASGLLIGGVLALVNHRWLQSSTSAAFAVLLDGQKPRLTIAKYALRYLIVGATVFAAYKLRIASLPALFAGLCSFVVALFFEASREFYFAITHGEETN